MRGITSRQTKIDLETIRKLAKPCAFICGAENPATVALKAAAESDADKDVKQARDPFLKLKPGNRAAAFAMISG